MQITPNTKGAIGIKMKMDEQASASAALSTNHILRLSTGKKSKKDSIVSIDGNNAGNLHIDEDLGTSCCNIVCLASPLQTLITLAWTVLVLITPAPYQLQAVKPGHKQVIGG